MNKNPDKDIDKQLLPRLRLMGIILLIFSCFSGSYALFLPLASPIDTPQEMEISSGFTILSSDGRVNAYSIAGIFAFVGACCIVIAKKRSSS
ncbi:MAG: hypothetical protein V4494_02570 [Chlamydiota bacterium]